MLATLATLIFVLTLMLGQSFTPPSIVLRVLGGEQIEAYGPLILDAIKGDRTLYKHRDEVESSWRICQPFLDSPTLRQSIQDYPSGSWGPPAADALLASDGRECHNPKPNEVR